MAAARRRRWVFIVLGVLAVALLAFALFHKPKKPPQKPPVVSVATAPVTTQDVEVAVTALGAAQAWRSDVIAAQVSGTLLSVNFTEGRDVRAGQVLAVIDPAPYEAALTQAEGQLHRDEAILAGAKRDLARYEVLAAQDSIARQTVEDEQAVVRQDEGVVQIDQGAVAAARVNLSRTRITAPISGRAGVRLVDPGNLVGSGAPANGAASSTTSSSGTATGAVNGAAGTSGSVTGGTAGTSGIVTINQIRPIAVTFTVPQGDFQTLLQMSDGFRKPLLTQAFTQETGERIGQGELQIADNKVDPSTGTVQLKARFENADARLWPGQYVNVRLVTQTLHDALTVPASAVQQGPQGPYVFVVQNGRAQLRPIKLQTIQGSVAVIASGLQRGETVVTDGQMTLKNGSQVRLPGQRPPAQAGSAPAGAGGKASG